VYQPNAADNRERVLSLIRSAVLQADAHGLIVTVEQRSVPPLAMGHLETVVSVREDRTGNHIVAARS
jgi:hypothetical protein